MASESLLEDSLVSTVVRVGVSYLQLPCTQVQIVFGISKMPSTLTCRRLFNVMLVWGTHTFTSSTGYMTWFLMFAKFATVTDTVVITSILSCFGVDAGVQRMIVTTCVSDQWER